MKIVATEALTDHQRAIVMRAAPPQASLTVRRCRKPDDFREVLGPGCDVLLTFEAGDAVIAHAPGLAWIQLLSAGADNNVGASALARQIPVTTASGVHAAAIAEYAIGAMLAFAHGLHISIRAQTRREWTKLGAFMGRCFELRGKTLGVVGYGSIGRELARLASGFGMTVVALKRDPLRREDPGWMPEGLGDPRGELPSRWMGPDERGELMALSDFVVVTLPLTPQTRHFIAAGELARAKPGAILVNVGRGGVIDERALAAALQAGKLGGGCLDVFEREPLPAENPLWEIDELIVTPHMAGASRLYFDRACALFADNLRRFGAGQPLLNRVDPALGY